MKSALQALLSNVNGNNIISIDTMTVPALLGGKSNPHKGNVRKVMIGGNVMVFTNKNSNGYENMVNRRLVKEGFAPKTFEVGPRTWGTRIEGQPFVQHKGQLYLEVIFLRQCKSHYELNGKPIAREAVNGLAPTPDEGQQGGLSDKVIIRTFAVDSVTAITIDGHRHYVELTC